MLNLKIEETKYTPQIIMDAQEGVVFIKGKSYPENTWDFYTPVVEWIQEYFNTPLEKTVLNFDITYFNSSSSKFFFDFFDLLDENREKSNIEINWFYDEEDLDTLESGNDFKEDFENLNFNLVKKES